MFNTLQTMNTQSNVISYGALLWKARAIASRLADQYNATYPHAPSLTARQVLALLEAHAWRCYLTGNTYRDTGLIIARVNGVTVPVAPAALPTYYADQPPSAALVA